MTGFEHDDQPEERMSADQLAGAVTQDFDTPRSVLTTLAIDHTPIGLSQERREGVILGTLMGWDEKGNPLVEFPGNSLGEPVAARSTVDLVDVKEGAELVLVFAQSKLAQPVILGVLRSPAPAEKRTPLEARVDGERVVLSADREIVLQCGKASITLTRAGKVLIRGTYVLSRSSGANRVKGGVVHIN